jgi:2',3'-cyclic-nucleotide 2'-phosphodiesterase
VAPPPDSFAPPEISDSFRWFGAEVWARPMGNRLSFPRAIIILEFLMSLRILCLGDIVGRPGRQVVHQRLPALVKQHNVDLVIANAENIAGGSGITTNLFHKLRSYGVDVVTLGDHVYKKIDIVPTMQTSERIVRPANLSSAAAGRASTVVTTNSGVSVGVFCLLGRIFMNLPSDDPFAAADRVLQQLPRHVRVCVCDIHAEASSEKVAMGHWLDGRCSMIFGTHTHIPTADAKILPGGSAFISDLGMCGPYDSVLGRRKDRVMKYMTTNMPHSFDVATNDVRLCGALAEIDAETGRAISIERIEVQGEASEQAYDSDDARPGNSLPAD